MSTSDPHRSAGAMRAFGVTAPPTPWSAPRPFLRELLTGVGRWAPRTVHGRLVNEQVDLGEAGVGTERAVIRFDLVSRAPRSKMSQGLRMFHAMSTHNRSRRAAKIKARAAARAKHRGRLDAREQVPFEDSACACNCEWRADDALLD